MVGQHRHVRRFAVPPVRATARTSRRSPLASLADLDAVVVRPVVRAAGHRLAGVRRPRRARARRARRDRMGSPLDDAAVLRRPSLPDRRGRALARGPRRRARRHRLAQHRRHRRPAPPGAHHAARRRHSHRRAPLRARRAARRRRRASSPCRSRSSASGPSPCAPSQRSSERITRRREPDAGRIDRVRGPSHDGHRAVQIGAPLPIQYPRDRVPAGPRVRRVAATLTPLATC